MNTPLQVGITGGIGSGKSLVSRIFHSLGAPVYDADSRAKKLMTTDGILVSQIKKEFGTLSYLPDGSLDRVYISKATFGHPDRLERLNQLVHPRVADDYSNWVASHRQSVYVLKEAALLYEAGSYKALDKVIVVTAPESIRLKRVLERDPQRKAEDVRDIMKRQWPEEEKAKRADFMIYNDDTQMVIPQVLDLHQRFISGS